MTSSPTPSLLRVDATDAGRSPDGPGSHASHGAGQAVSAVPVSIPSAGDWVLYREGYDKVRVRLAQAEKVTPKLVRFAREGWGPRQINHLQLVASFSDKETAERVRDQIGGVAGEYDKRRRAADDERSMRMMAAINAANRSVERLVAQASRQEQQKEGEA